jgi:hypothetical protein
VQVRQRHGVDVLGTAWLTEEVRAIEGEAGVVGHDDLEAEVAAGARSRLHGIVGYHADNHHLIDPVRTQPPLKRRMAEGIGHLLVQLAFVVPRHKRRLKLDT